MLPKKIFSNLDKVTGNQLPEAFACITCNMYCSNKYKKSKRHLKVYYLVLQYPEPTNFAKPPDGKTGHRSRNGTEKL
jgi:hypothetical protein